MFKVQCTHNPVRATPMPKFFVLDIVSYHFICSQCCGTLTIFFRIRILGSLILDYGSRSGWPIIYGSGSYLAIFEVIDKIMLSN
jgi:hypothetical protein